MRKDFPDMRYTRFLEIASRWERIDIILIGNLLSVLKKKSEYTYSQESEIF